MSQANQASSGAIIFDESDGNKHFQMQYDGLYDQLNFVGLDSSYVDLMSIERKGNVGIGTNSPAARLHVESSQRANSINRSCPAGTLWAGHIAGKASVDWNNDGYTDGNDYNILLGIDTNDYLEDNECVVFGTSTIGTDIDSGEFWVDTNLNRIVDEGEVITGANLGKPNVSGGKVSCETGHLWLDQNLNGYSPETGECIAPQYDDDSVILRTDFTGETCPVGTQKRDENQDGNTDDGECHIPAVLAKADGNLGIGTTAPQQALHVNGGIMASSLLLEDSSNPTLQAEGFFAHSHSIATEGAIDFEAFVIDGETYLAVANHREGSSTSSTRITDSKIYKWNNSTSNFDELQSIPTSGAYDFESFTIDGQTYLAVTDFYNGSYNLDSKIYEWNGSSFGELQSIPTSGATDFESFVIDGEAYLAVTYFHDGSSPNLESVIYKWDQNTNQFDQEQIIATNGGFDSESFVIDGETYLAVANHFDGSYGLYSKIYQWNSSTNQFEEVQAIATNGASDIESFTIDGKNYLAVGNYRNASTRSINSHIYQWNSSTNQFDEFQAIATNGAMGFKSFTVDGENYLAVANNRSDATNNIDSKIYQWNGSSFIEKQAIPTNGARNFESFAINGKTYLVVPNYMDDTSYNINSHIYTYDTLLSLSNTSTLAEDNPLFVFQNGTEELVTIENGGNVGIGTDEPGVELHIKDSVPRLRLEAEGTGAAANAYIEFNETDARKAWIGFGSTSNNDLTIYQENTDSDVVIPRGNVGIGTTEPRAKLEITSDGEENSDLLIHSKTTGTVGSPADWARISLMREGETDEGFLGFYGTNSAGTSSGLMLGVSGEHVIRFNTNGGDKMFIYPNGDVGIAGTVTAGGETLDSDIRYKKDIQTLPSALQNILSLHGVSYYWKDRDDDTQQIGVIAQEVEKIYPQLVHTNEDGYKSVAYANLVSPLIEAVKELHALYQGHADRIAALEEQIQQLQERYEDIEARLTALEAAQ